MLGAKTPPVVSELLKKPRGEQGVAVLSPLALFDPNLPPARKNVLGFEVAGFTKSQASAVKRH